MLKVVFAGDRRKKRDYCAEICAEKIECKGATPIATYHASSVDRFSGCPAVTYHAFGKGGAVYVGTISDDHFIGELLQRIVGRLGLQPIAKVPEGVEFVKRVKNGCEFIFVLNHSSKKRVLKVRGGQKELLTGLACRSLMIEPYGVRIIVRT